MFQIREFILLSILIHSLIFINFRQDENKESTKVNKGKFMNSFSVQVIENIKDNTSEGKETLSKRDFYWGLGIDVDVIDIGYYKITNIYQGYEADEKGLKVGDIIKLINMQPISITNDLRGDEPKKLHLTIERNSIIMYYTLERVKVYY